MPLLPLDGVPDAIITSALEGHRLIAVVGSGDLPATNDVTLALAQELADQGLSTLVVEGDMFAAGIHGSFDALGIHPYTYPYVPDDALSYNNYYNLGKYYDLLIANGDSDKQVWATEAGAPTGTYVGADRRAVSEATQAVVAQRIYEIAAKRPWQGPVFWFCFRDYGPDLGDIEQNFGLLHNDGTPKPAYDAFVAAMQVPL